MQRIHRYLVLTALPIVVAVGGPAAACWIKQPLAVTVAGADAILVGRIVAVREAEAGERRAHDVATIRVEQVLKGRPTLQRLGHTARRVALHFPSVNNRVRVSTDIHYRKGQHGIWLLSVDDGRLTAPHPDALQPPGKLKRIRALLDQQRLDPAPEPDLGPEPTLPGRRPVPIRFRAGG